MKGIVLASGTESRLYPLTKITNKDLPTGGGANDPDALVPFAAESHIDRPGHSRHYARSSAKLRRGTGWQPRVEFEEGLARRIALYREHPGWVERPLSGEYRGYYRHRESEPGALLESRRIRAAGAKI